jgi:hypothetical protein
MRRYVITAAIAGCILILVFMLAARKASFQNTGGTALEGVTMSKRIVAAEPVLASISRVGTEQRPADTHRSAWAPQIARTGKLSLFVDDPQKAVSAVAFVAHRYGGEVFSLELASGGGAGPVSADIEIRVPADRYDAAVNAVAAVGKVRDRSESAEDLTGDIGDSIAKLQNLQRTEADIRKIMDRSGSIEQILDVENQLSQVREQIQTLESDMRTMHEQVTYSTIEVSLQTEANALPVEATPGSQLAAAWQSAVHALVQTTIGIFSVVVWGAVFAPYALLLAGVALLIRRRRVRA